MSNREIFIEKLRQLSKEEMLERYIALLNTEKLTDYVADLEAKLAESKQETNDWKQRFESSEERFKTFNSNGVTALNLKNEKIEQLKQQLAEKEKEISVLKSQLCLSQISQSIDQSKIEFAIQQLQRVKEILVKKMKLATDKLNVAYEIDEIIKEIGEESEI